VFDFSFFVFWISAFASWRSGNDGSCDPSTARFARAQDDPAAAGSLAFFPILPHAHMHFNRHFQPGNALHFFFDYF